METTTVYDVVRAFDFEEMCSSRRTRTQVVLWARRLSLRLGVRLGLGLGLEWVVIGKTGKALQNENTQKHTRKPNASVFFSLTCSVA